MSLRCRVLAYLQIIHFNVRVENLNLSLAYEWLYHALILNPDAFIVRRRGSLIFLSLLLAEVFRLVKLR